MNLASNSVIKNVKLRLKNLSSYSEYDSFSNQTIENGVIRYTIESRWYNVLDYYATRSINYIVYYQYCY